MAVAQVGDPKKPVYRRPWFIVFGVLLGLVTIGSCSQVATPKKGLGAVRTGSSSSTTSASEEDNLNGPGAPTVDGPVVSSGAGNNAGAAACRPGDPLANVYHPNRLRVLQACMTVSGTVKTVRSEDDGDVHFDLDLDSQYSSMLTAENFAAQHGWLVVELVPADEPGCTPGQPPKPATGTYDYGICTGADESTPPVGSHVYVTGPYVLDEDHGGWAEIHPAWAVSTTLITPTTTAAPTTAAPTTQAAPPPTVAPPPPPTTAPPPGCYPKTSSGNCYEPGEYCPTADHGMTGVAGDGQRITCAYNNGWRWEAS